MAHAVEHLLFMGTKKYPVENAYNQCKTYEEPSESPLYGALDRFAQFFIEPLFLSSTLDHELQAVDSENKKNLQSDQWRLHQLEKSLSNPKHPYCHFSTGNFEVLKTEPETRGIDVRAKFMEFHGKHYSVNRMKLCVLGREPLDVLERWTAELFQRAKYPASDTGFNLTYPVEPDLLTPSPLLHVALLDVRGLFSSLAS
ncbi:zinc protease [Apiospora arundinis]|uniref:Zinc protease n=1 Tax=Apiospora arundinis TaxID=335852 RepID=A0ABR2IWK9_9PEZI